MLTNVLRFSCIAAILAVNMSPAASAVSNARLDPEVEAFTNTLGGPAIYTLTPAAARKVLDDLQSSTPVAKEGAIENTISIQSATSGRVSATIIRPLNSTGTLPGIIYIHGGGWILGDEATHDRLVRQIANGARAAVVFVNYTRSPEARFPVAVNQAYAVARYVAAHGSELKIDASRLAIAGDSVGGDMAASVTLMAKRAGGVSLKYQVLFYPVTDASMSDVSYHEFADGPWLSAKEMMWFWNAYEPDATKRNDPLVAPINASLEQLHGLPPALVVTDENDVLRDEGEAYAHRLLQAGVQVKAIRVLGTIHDFAMLNPLANTRETQMGIALASRELYTALH
jgi:acetyl esterase